jgi:methyl-accepting chemotaxis protein
VQVEIERLSAGINELDNHVASSVSQGAKMTQDGIEKHTKQLRDEFGDAIDGILKQIAAVNESVESIKKSHQETLEAAVAASEMRVLGGVGDQIRSVKPLIIITLLIALVSAGGVLFSIIGAR